MEPKYCPTCFQIIPILKQDEKNIPFDPKYHVVCKGCGWPVAKSLMKGHEVCRICRRTIEEQKKSGLRVV